jgi:hypothetical protein
MAGLLEALGSYVRGGYCQSLANLSTLGELMPGAGFGIGGAAGSAASFIYNTVCDRPPDPPPAPAFGGGQCDGITYNVSGKATYSGTAIPNGIDISGLAIGPIRGITSRNVPPNSTQVYVLGKPQGSNTTGEYGIATLNTSFGGGNDFQSVRITGLVRQDGQADNCGNLPTQPPPYQPGDNTVNAPVTYTNNEGDSVSVDASVSFGYATVNFNGTVSIPFTLNLQLSPEVNVSGNFNLNTGGIDFDFGNPALPGSECSPNSDDFVPEPNDPGNPVSLPPEVGNPPPTPDPPEYRKVMAACLVTTTEVGDGLTEVFQSDGVNFFVPDLGSIKFQISAGGKSGWTEPIKVQTLRQFIRVPWEGGAVAVRGTARPGGQFTITPLYVRKTAEQTFPD